MENENLQQFETGIANVKSDLSIIRDLQTYIKAVNKCGLKTGNCLQTLDRQHDDTVEKLGQIVEALTPLTKRLDALSMKIVSIDDVLHPTTLPAPETPTPAPAPEPTSPLEPKK